MVQGMVCRVTNRRLTRGEYQVAQVLRIVQIALSIKLFLGNIPDLDRVPVDHREQFPVSAESYGRSQPAIPQALDLHFKDFIPIAGFEEFDITRLSFLP